jgi:CSLREA domain-containing protein
MKPSTIRRLGALVASVGVLATLAAAPVRAGNVISVNDVVDRALDNGLCSLREAIIAANTNAMVYPTDGECPAGLGADTIVFPYGHTYDLVTLLPDITSSMTIDGANHTVLNATGGGGIAYVTKGAVEFRHIVLTGAGDTAIYNDSDAILTLSDVDLTGNTGDPALYNSGGTITITGSRLTINNSGGSNGGALYNNGGTVTVSDSIIAGNHGYNGAGIFNAGSLSIKRSMITDNIATGFGGGGGLYNNSTASISGSTFSGNSAAIGNGGGIVTTLHFTIANSTIAGNTSGVQGGGIWANTLSFTGSNLTVTGNTAPDGAGIYAVSSNLLVKNSIVTGNTGPDISGSALAAGSVPNVVGPIANLGSYLDIDGGPQDNGGPTSTVQIYKVTGSPFINTGSATVCAGSLVANKDQRGVTRPSTCDIGAVEHENAVPTMTAGPDTSIRKSQSLLGSSIQAKVTFAAHDNTGGSGVRRYVLAQSVNGGSWATLAAGIPPGSSYPVTLANGKTYRFRVRAVDYDANASSWRYGPTFDARLVQQTSTAVHYAKTWVTSSNAVFSGGSVRYAKAAGASATYTATGRAYAFVTTTGPTRGKAKIYVNGVLKATVDLYSASEAYRVQAWSIGYSTSSSRTIKVVVLGTSGRPRADLDAFAVLR